MAPRLKQPNCGGCGPCAGACTPPTVGMVTCASRSGNGTLCGWSKWQNYDSGDIGNRKYRSSVISGRTDSCRSVGGNSCGTSNIGHQWPGTVVSFSVCTAPTNSLTVTIDFDGSDSPCGSYDSADTQSGQAYSPDLAIPSPAFETDVGSQDGVDAHVNSSLSDTVRTLSGDATCFTDPVTGNEVKLLGTIVETLSVPDTVYDALGRGSPSSGLLCRSTLGTVASTAAHSINSIAFTGADAPRVTIPLSDLVIGESYELDILVNRYTAGGGGFVDTIAVTVSFTAEATSENYVYDVPVNTDYDYEYDSVTDARCAA